MQDTIPFQFHIQVYHEDDGSLYAEVLELPGCFTAGDTIDEIRENMQDAIECHLSGLTEMMAER